MLIVSALLAHFIHALSGGSCPHPDKRIGGRPMVFCVDDLRQTKVFNSVARFALLSPSCYDDSAISTRVNLSLYLRANSISVSNRTRPRTKFRVLRYASAH